MIEQTQQGSRPSHLAELTALRFFAAAAVVLFHVFPFADNPKTTLHHLVSRGYLGVDLFFILSGFILMHVYFRQYREGIFSYRGFLLNRIARVYPLHLFMIGVFLVVYLAGGALGLTGAAEGMNWAHLPWHILALHAWGFTDGHSWNFPSWSISAEFFAYLIFPLFLAVAARLRPGPAVLLSLVAFWLAYWGLAQAGYRLTAMMYDFGIVRIFFEFAIGVALYLAFMQAHLARGAALVLLAVLFALLLWLCTTQGSDAIIVPVLAGMIFAVASLSAGPQGSPLRAHPFVYLGEISYSTYMVHYLVIEVVHKLAPKLGLDALGLPALAMTFTGIYGASVVLYHVIELPFRQRIRALPLLFGRLRRG